MADSSFDSLLNSTTNLFNLTDEFKDELLLSKSIYNTTETRKNLEALGQTIQNLLIIEPGTYPNQPELGIGIENYQFEFLDSKTLSEIQERTDSQIKRFIPSSLYIDFQVDTIKNNLGLNVLYFSFNISATETAADKEGMLDQNITILFGTESKTKKILSKILI